MASEKPLYKEMMVFVKHHLADKHAFAPFTGQDWPAWMAFCYLLRCYGAGGGLSAIDAMRQTLFCAQHTEPVMQIFVQTIPGALDWGHVKELWPEIAGDLIIRGSHRLARHLVAYQRELDGKGIVAAYGVPRLQEVADIIGKS